MMTPLVGCLADGQQTTPSERPPTDTPEGFWRWVTITETTMPAEKHQVSVTVEVVQPWITAEETARIEISLTNEADARRDLGPVIHSFNFPVEGAEGIVLWDKTGYSDPFPPWCIGTDGKAGEEVGYPGENTAPHELAGGETITRTIIVADDYNVSGCLPTGTYPFDITHVARRPDANRGEGPTYTWNFTLGLRGDN